MADILSPEEIEALLTSLASDEAEEGTPSVAPSAAQQRQSTLESSLGPKVATRVGGYELYDFRRPDKLSKDQLRTLHMLHDTCARLASSSLAGFLRTPIQLELISVEQVPYEEYLRSINQSVFSILSLAPLSGQAVMEVEFGLIFSMIDRMLGGPGRGINRTSLTDIEKPLVTQLVEKMLGALKSAWEAIVIVNPRIEGMETSSQFVQIAPPTDIAVMILFEVKLGEQRGAMSLCIPYLVLKPITAKLAAQKWATVTNRKKNAANRRQMALHIQRSRLECKVELGRTQFAIGDFLSLKPGDVIRLDQKQTDPVSVHVKDHSKFLAVPIKSGKNFAIQITSNAAE